MEGTSIWTALAEAQAAMEQPVMDSEGRTGKNGARAYKYASLASVRRCVFPPCNERGIFVTQHFDGDDVLITEAFMGATSVVLDRRKVMLTGRSQEDGSAETYAKRYALCSIFGLAGIEDDDGSASQGAGAKGATFVARCRSCGAAYTFQSEDQVRSMRCCANPDYEAV